MPHHHVLLPSLVGALLTSCFAAAAHAADPPPTRDAATVLRAWLATDPAAIAGVDPDTLPIVGERRIGTTTLVHAAQTHAGLEVVGGSLIARVDARGELGHVRTHLVPIPPDLVVTPTLAAAQARRLAAAALDATPIERATDRLVISGLGAGEPRLAWDVRVARGLHTPRAHVDAHTGAVIWSEGQIRTAAHHRARVRPINAVVTPDPVEVVFSELAEEATSLSEPTLLATSCVDDQTCVELAPGFPSMMFCGLEQRAFTDPVTQDFTLIEPPPEQSWTDPAAELYAFHHITAARAAVRDIVGDPGFVADLALLLVANSPDWQMLPECVPGPMGAVPPPGAVLPTYDGAAYIPAGELSVFPDPTMVFGQGNAVDYAYDGDVIYHEFGHALLQHISSLRLVGYNLDRFGIDPSTRALDEGLADYVSSMITGDPYLAEEIAASDPAMHPDGYLRSLLNDKSCPRDIIGEEHADSEPWAAALWSIRSALAPEAVPAMNAAVVTVMGMLGEHETFATAAPLIAAELELRLGPPGRTLAEAEFARRGLDGCDDRVVSLDDGASKERMLIKQYPGVAIAELGVGAPAPLQFRLTLPEASDEVTLEIGKAAALGADGPLLALLLLKSGPEPITWTHGPEGSLPDTNIVAEVEFMPQGDGTHAAQTSFPGPFPPGPVHLQLVGLSPDQLIVGAITAHSTAASGTDSGDPGTASGPGDSEPGGSSGSGDMEDGDDGGCGCNTTEEDSKFAWLAVASGLALRRRRRLAGRDLHMNGHERMSSRYPQ